MQVPLVAVVPVEQGRVKVSVECQNRVMGGEQV